MDRIPWWKVGKTMVGGNPFASLGLDWCGRCRMEVDTETEAHCGADVYVYRRRCLRCGAPLKYGSCPITLIGDAAVSPKAVQWITTPGQDRR